MSDKAREARLIRDRQAELVAATDRARDLGEISASRRLVSIFNGGAMPGMPDHVYLSHPVDMDGAETEGGTAQPAINTASTIPVVVLWHSPQVGDLLVATSVGGRWVAERGGPPATDTICVTGCYPAQPIGGASVTILATSTGPVLFSGTTSAAGCLAITGISPGSYYVSIAFGGSTVYASSIHLAGGVNTIDIGSSGLVCCGGYAIPQNLYLTDAAGTISLIYDSTDGLYLPTWFGGHAVTQLSSTVTTPNNICTSQAPTMGPVRVCYQMTCNAGQNPVFKITRSWSWVYGPSNAPIWFQDPTGFTAGRYCITAPPPQCGNPLTDTAAFGVNPASASPFSLSGTPVATASNATTDPVGGSVAITS